MPSDLFRNSLCIALTCVSAYLPYPAVAEGLRELSSQQVSNIPRNFAIEVVDRVSGGCFTSSAKVKHSIEELLRQSHYGIRKKSDGFETPLMLVLVEGGRDEAGRCATWATVNQLVYTDIPVPMQSGYGITFGAVLLGQSSTAQSSQGARNDHIEQGILQAVRQVVLR